MANLQTDFPQITSRMVNPDGTITEAWYLFLVRLFERTGGTGGNGSAQTPNQIIEAAFSQTQVYSPFANAPLSMPDMTPPVPVVAIPMTEINFPPPAYEQPLNDIVYPQPVETASQSIPISASASPQTIIASRHQGLSVDGGTVTAITLARGTWTRSLAASTELIEMNTGDVVIITYTSAPVLTLLPR